VADGSVTVSGPVRRARISRRIAAVRGVMRGDTGNSKGGNGIGENLPSPAGERITAGDRRLTL
jgi:hypothetical protein